MKEVHTSEIPAVDKGDARTHVPVVPADVVVTSPPYWRKPDVGGVGPDDPPSATTLDAERDGLSLPTIFARRDLRFEEPVMPGTPPPPVNDDDEPWYEFYSPAGDRFAHVLIELARVNGPLTPAQVAVERDAIQHACAEAGFAEAYDTACREAIEFALERPSPALTAVVAHGDGARVHDRVPTVEVALTLSQDEANALLCYWSATSDLGEVQAISGVDLAAVENCDV